MQQQAVVRGGVIAVLLALLLYVVWTLLLESPMFSNLVGPAEATMLPSTPPPTTAATYTTTGNANNNGVAVLVKDKDSSWLGIAHGLKSIGVPFTIVSSVDEALQ